MEFLEVQRRVFDLYGSQRYEEGLQVIARARPNHPDKDGRLTFWEACLLGMSGRSRQALEVLTGGLDRGLWWAPEQLADSDLDSARRLPGWAEMLARSERATSEATPPRPDPSMRPATTVVAYGTLVTLHGAGADPSLHAREWEAAAPESWTVVTPSGNVPMSSGGWAWPFDLSSSPVTEQLRRLDLVPPLILSGWSQGGGLAASMAWKGELGVAGLLLIGPGLRDSGIPAAQRHVPTYMVIGEHDLNLPACLDLADRLTAAGVPMFLDQRPGRGHEPPRDLRETINSGLDWLVANMGPADASAS